MVASTLQFSGAWSKVLNLPKELTWGRLSYPDTGPYFSAQFSSLVCDTPSTGKKFFLVLKLLIQFAWGYYFLRNFQKHLKFNGSHNLARELLSTEFSLLSSFTESDITWGWRETLGRRARRYSADGRALTLGLCLWQLYGIVTKTLRSWLSS